MYFLLNFCILYAFKDFFISALSKNLNFLIWIKETAYPETDEERERLKKIDELIREILIKKININYIKRDTIQYSTTHD